MACVEFPICLSSLEEDRHLANASVVQGYQSIFQVADHRLSIAACILLSFSSLLEDPGLIASPHPWPHGLELQTDSFTTLEGVAESSIPLLRICHDCQSATMSSGESFEKRSGAVVAVGATEVVSSSPNPYGDNAVIAYEDEAAVVNQSRLRRLFSFV